MNPIVIFFAARYATTITAWSKFHWNARTRKNDMRVENKEKRESRDTR